jgi:hypothetical protein
MAQNIYKGPEGKNQGIMRKIYSIPLLYFFTNQSINFLILEIFLIKILKH